ncbi:MAG: 2'-5' RNA ligase family protein [Planctomycetes bacterium]|nr:2'-5' RNA ligase family protein [Planctomycetota bacterium]
MQTDRSEKPAMHQSRIRIKLIALPLVMAFLKSDALSIAIEPPLHAITAIDVLLLPDAAMLQLAKVANDQLRAVYPKGFALDATHRPHITLLQRYVRTKDLNAVYNAVSEVFDRKRPAGWELEATGYYYLNFENHGLAGIVIRPTPQLVQLQQEVIDAVKPYTEPEGNAEAYVTSPEFPDINESTLQYVETFIPERIGKNYNPHVTVGVGPLDFVEKMKAAPFQKTQFKVMGAAVFQLGDNGTAQKQLWAWTLPKLP